MGVALLLVCKKLNCVVYIVILMDVRRAVIAWRRKHVGLSYQAKTWHRFNTVLDLEAQSCSWLSADREATVIGWVIA